MILYTFIYDHMSSKNSQLLPIFKQVVLGLCFHNLLIDPIYIISKNIYAMS